MASLNSVLDIAKTALLTSQKAINVTSHNISNANTEGYTRQQASISALDPVSFGGLFFGTGVTIDSISRVYDAFQALQLRDANSDLSSYSAKQEHLKVVEAVVNDFSGSGLSEPIDNFFNAILDISNDPSSAPERFTLLSNATVLADNFNRFDAALRNQVASINNQLTSLVKEVNSLASQVADLNGQISNVEIGGVTANDLRDQRDLVLTNLAKIVDISTMENDSGQVDVFVGSGSFLVSGVKTSTLEVAIDNEKPELYNVVSNGVVLDSRLSGGSIKGVLDAGTYLLGVQDKLNTLAASMVKEVNLVHQAGYGLDSSTGLDFFTPLSVTTKSAVQNSGGAVISGGTVSNLSLVTLKDYEVRFADPSTYSIVRTDTGAVVSTGTYTSGSAITVDGLSFTISDNTGTPAAGDRFSISVTEDAAVNMAVSITDPNKIAASASAATLPGDNTNALALAALKDATTVEGVTFSDYYYGLVTDIGVASGEAKGNMAAQDKVVEQLEMARESLSGVSLEEEAVNLIKLQRAYEAAAQVLKTADSMYDTLVNLR